MGGGTPIPAGYVQQSMNTYSNNDTVKKQVKDGYIYPNITVIDSRGFVSKSTKKIAISFFKAAYLSDVETTRENGMDSAVRLVANGKICIGNSDEQLSYIKYTASTATFDINGNTTGTKYGPFNVNLSDSSVVIDRANQNFSVNCLIQGDLGASGFTKGKIFYILVQVASNISQFGPSGYLTTVENGTILQSIGNKGVAFGADYDENVGGIVQGIFTGIKQTLQETSTPSTDTRSINSLPPYYWSLGVGKYREFKFSSTLGVATNDGHFGQLETTVPWADSSGGCIMQVFYELNPNLYIYKMNKRWVRYSNGTSAWGPWFSNYNITSLKSIDYTTTPGNTNIHGLNEYYADFDFLLVCIRGDWNHILNVVMPITVATSRTQVSVCAYVSSYDAYGYCWFHDNNQLSVYCDQAHGWSGLGCCGIYGFKVT